MIFVEGHQIVTVKKRFQKRMGVFCFSCTLLLVAMSTVGNCSTYQGVGMGISLVPTDIPSDATGVHLSNNFISDISPDDFAGISGLLQLYLDHNRLTVFPDIGDAKASLQVLVLNSNSISTISSKETAGYTSLLQIYLIGNQMIQFPDLSDAKKNLNILYLQHNSISKIVRQDLDGFEQLNYLELGYNNLTSMPDLHFITKTIISVNVESNQIMHYHPWSVVG